MIYWHIPNFVWWILGPVVAWRISVRLYRLLARQQYVERHFWLRAGGLTTLTVAVGCIAFEEHVAFWLLGVGLLCGIVLAIIGVRLTSIETGPNVTFIRPDQVIGLLLTTLLVGRILWRLSSGSPGATLGWNVAEFVRNPSTMLLFGLFSAHYITYSVGIAARMRYAAPDS